MGCESFSPGSFSGYSSWPHFHMFSLSILWRSNLYHGAYYNCIADTKRNCAKLNLPSFSLFCRLWFFTVIPCSGLLLLTLFTSLTELLFIDSSVLFST